MINAEKTSVATAETHKFPLKGIWREIAYLIEATGRRFPADTQQHLRGRVGYFIGPIGSRDQVPNPPRTWRSEYLRTSTSPW